MGLAYGLLLFLALRYLAYRVSWWRTSRSSSEQCGAALEIEDNNDNDSNGGFDYEERIPGPRETGLNVI